MNKIQQRIFQDVVAPALRGITGLRTGVIRDINHVNKTASIAFTDTQREDGNEVLEVSIVRQNGMHEAGPFIGDEVLIGFLNNNLKTPIIIGAVDSAYEVRRRQERDRHERQGALLSDLYTMRTGANWNV